MNYFIIGDSLIQKYKSNNIMCFPGMTLEKFLIDCNILLKNKEVYNNEVYNNEVYKELYIFCFGLNDLSGGISEDDVINNYNILCQTYNNCMIILPPLQSMNFYNKCIDNINTNEILILTFIDKYTTIDGIHPTEEMLNELKKDIEN